MPPATAAKPARSRLTLETEDLRDVELVAVGTHDASTGRVKLTKKDLADIVDAYKATRGVLNVPAKIGHADDENMLPKGLNAAGWLENVRLVGSKLVADIMRVPKKLAELLRAGAWRSRSVEIRHDYEVTGKGTFRRVLTGLAWLGAELPAVKGLEDVFDLYGADPKAARAFLDGTGDGIVHILSSATQQDLDDALALFEQLQQKVEPLVAGQKGVREARAILSTAKRQLSALIRRAANLAAVPNHDPPVPDDDAWDGQAAIDELRAWASTDGSGDPETIDFEKYAQGFAVVDGAPDNLASYKFPHHRVTDGELVTSRAGVIAAWTAAQGGRSGERNEDASRHLNHHRDALGIGEDDDEGDSDMETTKLAEKLGLDAKATEEQILAKLDELKAAAPKPKDEPDTKAKDKPKDPGDVGTQVTALSEENAALKDRVLKMEAAELTRAKLAIFEKACAEGRYLPAQKDDFLALAEAFTDEKGLKKLTEIVARQQKVVQFGELGGADLDGADFSEFEPTRDELTVAEQIRGHELSADDRWALTVEKAALKGRKLPPKRPGSKTTTQATA